MASWSRVNGHKIVYTDMWRYADTGEPLDNANLRRSRLLAAIVWRLFCR